jgi:pimeloyl-ACP methyl ester carboxylesterase
MNPAPDSHVPCGQARIAAWCAGAGMPVVLLHAGVADSRMWRGQFAALAGRAQAIAYDRRGFGRTAAAPGDFAQVADLLAVLDALAPGRRALLVGCSQGGRIAIDAALAHPARVAGLALIGTAVSAAPPLPLQPAAERLEAAIAAADDLAQVNELEAHLWLDGPTAPRGRVGGAARALFLDMNGIALAAPALGRAETPPSAYDRLARIAVPTCVAWGNLDCADVIGWSRHIAATVPGARRAVFPAAAHLPPIEAPEAVLRLIDGMLDAG